MIIRFCFIAVQILILLSVASCTQRNKEVVLSAQQRTVNVQAGDLGHKPWDYHASAKVVWNFNSAVFTPLVTFDEKFDLVPGIIKDWQWDEATKSYLLTINTSLQFRKNRRITAKDVEFTLLKPYLADDYPQAQELLRNIKGISSLKPKQKYKSGMCEGVRVEGEGLLRIFLAKENPMFLYSLGWAMAPVGPIEDFKSDLVTFKKWPVGTGNYEIIESTPELNYVLLRRKNFDSELKLPEKYPLVIKFFLTGDAKKNKLDLAVGTGTRGTKNNPSYTRFFSRVTTSIQVVDFNFTNSYGSNVNFRKAISLALSRSKILAPYDKEEHPESHELVPGNYYGRSNTKFKFNPDEAKQILSSQFPELGGVKLKATYHGVAGEPLPKYVKSMQSQLKSIGLDIEFTGVSACVFTDNTKDIVFTTYGNPTNFVDPLMSFSLYLGLGERKYHGLRDDEAVKDLFEKASVAKDRQTKATLMAKLTKHFQKGYRQLPIFENKTMFAYSNRIKSVSKDSIDYAFDFDKVEVSGE